MKRLMFAALLAAAACGGNNNEPGQDAPPPPPPGSDANPGSDAPPPPATTLTSYVIDLVTNHTTATDLPRPFTEFQALPDPDGANNNLVAYQSLFP